MRPTFCHLLAGLVDQRGLSAGQARELFEALFDGRWGDSEAAAVLVALRMKGETAAELAAAARALRARMVRLPTGGQDVLDTCGTGGDGSGTFNISTAVAFVAAGAGVRVVKHGNRAASGRTGSADVLRELGLPVEAGPEWAARCLREVGLAFCFAPHFHPAMTRLADLRRRLGVRTILNCLGPLANPAGAAYQLVGVGRPDLLDPVAGALAELGSRRALVISGLDGFDEVSLSGPTLVRDVRSGHVSAHEWKVDDFGMDPCRTEDLQATDAAESAALIGGVLADRPGPARRVVVANAAAALLAADRVGSLREGVAVADATIRTGLARQVLERLRACG
ncbi:MAG TPA: anthranilate phosphoribosyltransferase [Gemmataceae bacterium]